jgi:Zn ribbon nucleic-acid-binding protein
MSMWEWLGLGLIIGGLVVYAIAAHLAEKDSRVKWASWEEDASSFEPYPPRPPVAVRCWHGTELRSRCPACAAEDKLSREVNDSLKGGRVAMCLACGNARIIAEGQTLCPQCLEQGPERKSAG